MPRLVLSVALLLLLLVPRAGSAQDTSLIQRPDLPQDSIRLMDEEFSRQGCIVSEGEETMEFLEIVQKPGRRVALVSRPIPLAEILPEHTVRLGDAQRQQLLEWIEQVRQRATIEAGRQEEVELTEVPGDGRESYRYEGSWFRLESNADAETTRRCVVRIEQIFRAYRLILPPRTEAATPLRIRLFGSMETYHAYLAQQGIDLNNPAYYAVQQNLIVAGSELSLFAENLAEVRLENAGLREQLEHRRANLSEELATLSSRLSGLGFSREEINDAVALSRKAEEDELNELSQQLLVAERLNDRSFNQLSETMFRRLYHEALHAYIENYVFPHDLGEVPPWLNEGLALIFEGGQLDGEQLRIDTPHNIALAQLKSDFDAGYDQSLRAVILAESEDFHFRGEEDQAAARYYAYAWGLTWYLTMETESQHGPPLTLSQIERCLNPPELAPTASKEQRLARFETLVGMPLEDFEPLWREAMREMW